MSKEAETIKVGQLEIVFFAAKSDTDGHADVFELRVPAGAKVPGAHYHVGMDEVLVGVEGTLTYVVGEEVHDIGPGDRAFSPRGVLHYFVNRTKSPARALVIGTPANLGPQYFRDVGAVIAASAGGPPDMARLVGVMKSYGLEPAPLSAQVQALLSA
jgi:mannose-6-phosphate isomerase-like protein (cupin superfamily)